MHRAVRWPPQQVLFPAGPALDHNRDGACGLRGLQNLPSALLVVDGVALADVACFVGLDGRHQVSFTCSVGVCTSYSTTCM